MKTLAFLLAIGSAPVVEPPSVYTPTQAVADLLSGPLKYVGRGGWFGMARWESCVYRNQRVLVVDVYCSRVWPDAFSVRVFSPVHGRVQLYLESATPVTELSRAHYDDSLWRIESEPPPSSTALPTPLRLDMGFEDLRDYEEARYQLYLPACAISNGKARCHRNLSSSSASWAAVVEPFWRAPGQSWRRLIEQMRALAGKHGT